MEVPSQLRSSARGPGIVGWERTAARQILPTLSPDDEFFDPLLLSHTLSRRIAHYLESLLGDHG